MGVKILQPNDQNISRGPIHQNEGITDTETPQSIAKSNVQVNPMEDLCWWREGFALRPLGNGCKLAKGRNRVTTVHEG